MPEPEQWVLMLLAAGAAAASVMAGAMVARGAWRRSRAAGVVAGSAGCLVAGVIGIPAILFCASWGRYWWTRPGPEAVRAALPGTWQGTGRWSGDRLVVADDGTFLQTVESPGHSRREVRGTVVVMGDTAGFSQLWVPSDASLSDPETPEERVMYGDYPLFRLGRREGGLILVFQNPGDTPYEFWRPSAPSEGSGWSSGQKMRGAGL